MPRKQKKKKKIVVRTAPNLRGKGGLKEFYNGVRNWSNNAGRPFMDAGRTLLDAFFPGAGLTAKRVMNLLGWGAYHGSKNTILQASPVPQIHAMPDRGVRVIHKEFLGQVTSSASFSSTTYAINPGIAATFPWLAGVASNFQKYKLNGLIFYFKSTAANVAYSTNNALGSVVGVTQYNVYDPEPVSLSQVLNISGVMEEKPTRDCIFPVECDRFHAIYPAMFVRDRIVSDDQAKYDPGKFVLCTSGSQAAAVVGQLWVAYDITLIQPIPESLTTGLSPVGGCRWTLAGNYAAIAPFGTPTKVTDNLATHRGGTMIMDSTGVTFPPFDVPTTLEFTSIQVCVETDWKAPAVTYSNATQVQYKAAASNGVIIMSVNCTVDDPSLSGTIGFSGGTAPSTPLMGNYSYAHCWAYPAWSVSRQKPSQIGGSTTPPPSREEKEEDEGYELACGNTSSVSSAAIALRSVNSPPVNINIKQNKNNSVVRIK